MFTNVEWGASILNKIIISVEIRQPRHYGKHPKLVVVSLLPASGRDKKTGAARKSRPRFNCNRPRKRGLEVNSSDQLNDAAAGILSCVEVRIITRDLPKRL